MSESMTQSWEELTEFIVHRHSLDIGALNRLLLLAHHSHIDDALFTQQVVAFFETISAQAKMMDVKLHTQALALIAIDALVFNIYRMGRGGEGGFKPSSSSFYGWMSMSQLSVDISDSSTPHEHPRRAVSLIEQLANSEPLNRRIKLITDRPTNRERNHRYAENFLQTMDYVLSRQKCPRDNFLKLRGRLGMNPVKNKPAVNFQQVNQLIFSNQLNKISRLLTQSPDELHLALIRIYFAEQEEGQRKQFQGRVYTGADMLHNLHRYYIQSFQDENDLFEQSKHPLFRLIRNQLVLFFGPFLVSFHTAVSRLGLKGDQENAWQFYKNSETALREELLRVVRNMPSELVSLLHELSKLIEQTFHIKRENCIALVKKLLFYCFLCSQTVIEDLLPHVDPTKYSALYNHIINLFFHSSLRKFTEFPQQKLTLISGLVEEIAGSLDERIGSDSEQVLEEEVEPNELNFRLKDPILNYDYQLVSLALVQIEFTPKDIKKFTMIKKAEEDDSPVYKHFRKETSVMLPREPAGETDMAAWMSVGGSRDWGQTRQSAIERLTVKERLSGLTTLRGEKVKQLNMLRSQFQHYLS